MRRMEAYGCIRMYMDAQPMHKNAYGCIWKYIKCLLYNNYIALAVMPSWAPASDAFLSPPAVGLAHRTRSLRGLRLLRSLAP